MCRQLTLRLAALLGVQTHCAHPQLQTGHNACPAATASGEARRDGKDCLIAQLLGLQCDANSALCHITVNCHTAALCLLPSLDHPLHRYTAVDSRGRSSEFQVHLRVQAAARHAFRLQVALACSNGPEQLQQEVRCSIRV